jgi:hypothetical protein
MNNSQYGDIFLLEVNWKYWKYGLVNEEKNNKYFSLHWLPFFLYYKSKHYYFLENIATAAKKIVSITPRVIFNFPAFKYENLQSLDYTKESFKIEI